MSFLDKIENLQKKPESIRRRVLFFSVATIMFIVIISWVFTLKFSFRDNKQEEFNSTPFWVLGSLLEDTYDMSVGSVKQGFDQLKKQFNYGGE